MVVRFLVVGFLAAVFWMWLAVPTCGCSTRAAAYSAAMKSDLKNLAAQQEIHFSEHERYSTRPEDLAFVNSDGVLVDIRLSPSGGWSARATHVVYLSPDSPNAGEDCVIYAGDVDGVPRTTVRGLEAPAPGEAICDYRRPPSVKRAVTDFLFGWM